MGVPALPACVGDGSGDSDDGSALGDAEEDAGSPPSDEGDAEADAELEPEGTGEAGAGGADSEVEAVGETEGSADGVRPVVTVRVGDSESDAVGEADRDRVFVCDAVLVPECDGV